MARQSVISVEVNYTCTHGWLYLIRSAWQQLAKTSYGRAITWVRGGSTVPNLLYLSTYLEEKQGVQGAFALVRGSSSASNLLEPSRTTALQI